MSANTIHKSCACATVQHGTHKTADCCQKETKCRAPGPFAVCALETCADLCFVRQQVPQAPAHHTATCATCMYSAAPHHSNTRCRSHTCHSCRSHSVRQKRARARSNSHLHLFLSECNSTCQPRSTEPTRSLVGCWKWRPKGPSIRCEINKTATRSTATLPAVGQGKAHAKSAGTPSGGSSHPMLTASQSTCRSSNPQTQVFRPLRLHMQARACLVPACRSSSDGPTAPTLTLCTAHKRHSNNQAAHGVSLLTAARSKTRPGSDQADISAQLLC